MAEVKQSEVIGGMTTVFEGSRATARRLNKAKLTVVEGPDEGIEAIIDSPLASGGRGKVNTLVLSDQAVSGMHFEILVSAKGHLLRDLNSSNGVHIGDLRIQDAYLSDGAVFRVGRTRVRFDISDEVIDIALSKSDRFDQVLGSSTAMREVFAQLEKFSTSRLTVLITGETGTGKELVARAIHNASPRKDGPFVVLDCGAIPRELIESTLFGHERGSFTGAVEQHEGVFEQADGGTIFLDEIGELDITMQPKLLRVLEQREVKRVGGSQTHKVDVRVVAATNRDLRAEVDRDNFREDLYFRLSVAHVQLPALRERLEDIPMIANRFLSSVSTRRDTQLSFGPDAIDALLSRRWPGNVRELRNIVERAAALTDGPVISRADLVFGQDSSIMETVELVEAGATAARQAAFQGHAGPALFDPQLVVPGLDFKQAKQAVVDAFERAYLAALVERHGGNITRSAQEAGLTRYHLRELLKRHELAGRQAAT